MTMKTKEDLMNFLASNHACAEGITFAQGKTPAEFWESTVRGEWLLEIQKMGAWDFADSDRVKYLAAIQQPREEFRRKIDLASDVSDPQPAVDAAVAELRKVMADTIRAIVTNPFGAEES
jgi:hypothetical protein